MVEFLRKNRQAVLSMNGLRIALARSYDEYLDDLRAEAIEQGIEQGIERGAYDKAVEMAKIMLNSKAPLDDIIKFSGLPAETIQSLAS